VQPSWEFDLIDAIDVHPRPEGRQSEVRPNNIHLSQNSGYELYANKLKPLVEALLKRR